MIAMNIWIYTISKNSPDNFGLQSKKYMNDCLFSVLCCTHTLFTGEMSRKTAQESCFEPILILFISGLCCGSKTGVYIISTCLRRAKLASVFIVPFKATIQKESLAKCTCTKSYSSIY